MPRVIDIELLDDAPRRARPDQGFLQLRRLMARNRYADGGGSQPYPLDVIDRPALDAVAVCAWCRSSRGVDVLTRSGLRPAALFRRERTPALP